MTWLWTPIKVVVSVELGQPSSRGRSSLSANVISFSYSVARFDAYCCSCTSIATFHVASKLGKLVWWLILATQSSIKDAMEKPVKGPPWQHFGLILEKILFLASSISLLKRGESWSFLWIMSWSTSFSTAGGGRNMHSISENELLNASVISLHLGVRNFWRSHSVGELEPTLRSISLSSHRKFGSWNWNSPSFHWKCFDIVTHQLYTHMHNIIMNKFTAFATQSIL